MALAPPHKLIALFSIGTVLSLIGIITYVTFPVILRSVVEKKLYLIDGTIGYKYWKDIPVPIYLNLYFFNITNPDEVYALKSKPVLEELGPYVFREERTKVEIGWNENGTLSYRQVKHWYFRSDLSNGSLSDNITQINTIMMAAAAKGKETKSILFDIVLSGLFRETGSTWFIEKTVGQLLFEGYTDRLFNMSKTFETLPFDKFGWFYGRNGSDDGLMTIFTGLSDINNLDVIDKFNGFSTVSAYDPPCNMVNGTAGDLWFPFQEAGGQIEMFVPDICRTLHLTYLETREVNNLKAFRYWADQTELDNGKTNPDNKCFCIKDPCLPPGALDISKCKFDAPATVSYPHFLFADSSYSQGVIGLKPDPKKHAMYIDINPEMGIPLNVAARMQINVLFEHNEDIMQFQNVTGSTYIPVFWFSNTATIDDAVTNELKVIVKTLPLAVDITCGFLMAIGILLIITAFIYGALYVNGRQCGCCFAHCIMKSGDPVSPERQDLTAPESPREET